MFQHLTESPTLSFSRPQIELRKGIVKLQNAITLCRIIRFRIFFFSFHVTFRGLRRGRVAKAARSCFHRQSSFYFSYFYNFVLWTRILYSISWWICDLNIWICLSLSLVSCHVNRFSNTQLFETWDCLLYLCISMLQHKYLGSLLVNWLYF